MPREDGRPTKYSDELVFEAVAMASSGCTNDEIAETLGIHRDSLYEYLRKYPDFSDAIKHAKSIANRMVQAAAFRRAIGFKRKAIKIQLDQESGKFKTHEYIEHLAPDPTMIQYWLNNRCREDWQPPKPAGPEIGGDSPITIRYDPSKRLETKKTQPKIVDVTPIKNSGDSEDGSPQEE